MKTLIVYNPKSGRGKFKDCIDTLIMALKEININDVSVFSSDRPKEITDFLLLQAHKFSILILSGGDGTLNECINALMLINHKPQLLYIPSGTVNDVGRMLKLSKKPLEAIKLLVNKPVKMDVVQINNRYFLYAAACGKFSNVSYETKHHQLKKRMGKFYYYLRTIKDLFVDNRFCVNRVKAYLFLVLNTNSLGSFKLRWQKSLKLNDGLVRLMIFPYKNKLSFLHFVFFMLLGDYYKFGRIDKIDSQFELTIDKNLTLNTDGEVACVDNCFKIIVHREAIALFVEKDIKKLYFE